MNSNIPENKNERIVIIGGGFAWFLWMAVYLQPMLGMRNRLEVLLNWIWNYLTYDQSLLLIFRDRK